MDKLPAIVIIPAQFLPILAGRGFDIGHLVKRPADCPGHKTRIQRSDVDDERRIRISHIERKISAGAIEIDKRELFGFQRIVALGERSRESIGVKDGIMVMEMMGFGDRSDLFFDIVVHAWVGVSIVKTLAKVVGKFRQ